MSLLEKLEKIGCVLKSKQGRNRSLLQEGQVNLNGARVVFDRDIPHYSVSPKSEFVPFFENPHLKSDRMDMPRRRITAFKNPDLILLLIPDGWFNVRTKADLFTLEDYKERHQKFLRRMGEYGFIHEGDRTVSVFQELVDRECEIYEEVFSAYGA